MLQKKTTLINLKRNPDMFLYAAAHARDGGIVGQRWVQDVQIRAHDGATAVLRDVVLLNANSN